MLRPNYFVGSYKRKNFCFLELTLMMSSLLLLLLLLNFTHASGNDGSTTDNEVTSCGKAEVEDGDIDEYLNTLEQDDPILIEAIKSYYLDRPNTNFDLKVPPKRLQRERIGGQFDQGAYVMKLMNFTKKNGFFIEAGAYDGVVASNTLLMEVMYDWTGILVEANPDSYSRLLTANRNVFSVGHCLSTKPRPEVVLFDAADIFGGILREGKVKPGDNIPITDRKRMIEEVVKPNRKTLRIQCFPLYSLLLSVGNPVVDYLSLDTEGTELDILKSLPWDKVDIRVLTLEITRGLLNENLSAVHIDPYPDIIEFMESKGYTEVKTIYHTPEKISQDSVFVRNDLQLNIE